MARSSAAALTPLAMAALELLHEGPRHPYEIHQALRERHADKMVKLSAGTLYHSIERLDRDGFIEVVETSREGRRPERTTYRLTQAGRDAFADRLRGMVSTVADEYPEFGIAIELLHTLDQRDAVNQLRTRMIALESRIAALQVWIDRLNQTDLHPLFWPQVRLRLTTMRAELDWITELVGQLESGAMSWPDGAGAGRADLRLADNEPTRRTDNAPTRRIDNEAARLTDNKPAPNAPVKDELRGITG